MYPYLRLFWVLTRARLGAKVAHGWGHHTLRLRAWPTDIDVYPEVNNGRHLVLMDLGRYDLAVRLGLTKVLRKQKWAFIIGGSTVRYRHRLRPFRRFELHTDLIGATDRWFIFHQWTVQRGQPCSSALIKAGVTRKGGLVRPSEVMSVLHGGPLREPVLSTWVETWLAADEMRPWPPEPSSAAAGLQALSAAALRLDDEAA